MLWKCCTQYASKFGKLSSGHRPEKGQFSFQSQRKAMPNNAQTTAQLHSSHTLVKSCLKFSKPGFNSTWTMNFQMFKLDLEKVEGKKKKKRQRNQRSNCQHLLDHWKSKRVPEKHLFLLYWLCQSLWLCGSQQTGKFLNSLAYQTTWPASWEICTQVRKQQLELYMEQDWFQIGKGVCQGCILSSCLFNFYAEYIMRNTGLEKAQAGIKIARKKSVTSDTQMTPPLWQKVKKN